MKKCLLLGLFTIIMTHTHAQDYVELKGKIAGKLIQDDGQPALGAQIFVYTQDNSEISGSANTGDDNTNKGLYTTNAIDTGKYNVHIKYDGYRTMVITGVPVKLNKSTPLTLKLSRQSFLVSENDTISYLTLYPPPKPKKKVIDSTTVKITLPVVPEEKKNRHQKKKHKKEK